MEKIETIILVTFDSKTEALNYFETSGLTFAFKIATGEIFNSLGNQIEELSSYEDYALGTIAISNKIDPLPGELHIENGFLKYYKEI